jgi:hypothetical protein
MNSIINNQLASWDMARTNWLNRSDATYLNQKVISHQLLGIPTKYHDSDGYDLLTPPLQILGNLEGGDKDLSEKILLVSLEPLKTKKDFAVQYNYFFNTTGKFDPFCQVGYGCHHLNINNYLQYQTDYFNVFPKLLGLRSPYTKGSNRYWRYIDCFTNGYLNNLNLRSENWDTLGRVIIDIPLIPLWAKSHPQFSNHVSVRNLFLQKLKQLKPTKILVTGTSKWGLIKRYLDIADDNFRLLYTNGMKEWQQVYLAIIDTEWGQCKVYFSWFISGRGNSLEEAKTLGDIVRNN